MKAVAFLLLVLLGFPTRAQTAFPPISSFPPVADFGYGVQRTMHLLAASTPEQRNTVRILFYGQSITEQEWWRSVSADLRARFPHANLVIENRAIGGFESHVLLRTAETDLFPFYPDLVIFHVYGSMQPYEQLIRHIRERTTSEIILQTDHIISDASLNEVTNPANQADMNADALRNYVLIPRISHRYGAELADVRSSWKKYLSDHALPATELLRDHIHLNAHGEFLMAELIKLHLRYRPEIFPSGWKDAVKTFVVGRDITWTNGGLEFEFEGNRVDFIARPGAVGITTNYIDGLVPSEFKESYVFTRSSPPAGTWRPALTGIRSETRLLVEDWTLTITDYSPSTRQVQFRLEGSLTGPDGEGSSAATFVSNSGRIILEPAAWETAKYMWAGFPPEPGFQITWSVMPLARDQFVPPAQSTPGVEPAVTIAQDLPNGPHTLRVIGGLESPISAVRIYNPEAMRIPSDNPRMIALEQLDAGWEIQVRSWGSFQLEVNNSDPAAPDNWLPVGEPSTASRIPLQSDAPAAFFRLRQVSSP